MDRRTNRASDGRGWAVLCHLPRAHLYDCIPLRSNSPPPYLGPLGSRVRGRPSGSPDWTHKPTCVRSPNGCRPFGRGGRPLGLVFPDPARPPAPPARSPRSLHRHTGRVIGAGGRGRSVSLLFGVCAKLPSPPRLEAAPRAHAHTSPQLSPVRDSVTSAQPSSSGVCLDVSAYRCRRVCCLWSNLGGDFQEWRRILLSHKLS